MDVGVAFVADAEAPVLVEPGEGALDDPALPAESGSVLGSTFGDARSDPAGAERLAVSLRVVAAVGEERVRPTAWSSAYATQRRDRLDEREQLRDVWAVGAGEQAGERDTVGVDDQVVLAAGLAPVDGAGTGLVAPKSARSEAESQIARERSSRPAWRSRVSSSSCSCCQTPACCQSRRRRQQVMPEPKPSSCGSRGQAIPVVSTNRIPFNTWRSSSRLRPG